jgi:hypothetical protein
MPVDTIDADTAFIANLSLDPGHFGQPCHTVRAFIRHDAAQMRHAALYDWVTWCGDSGSCSAKS